MTRELCRQEGIWVGYSAGTAVTAIKQLKDKLSKDDVVVVIFHDHGTRYLAKIFNDDWMRKMGYFDKKGITAQDLVATKESTELLTIPRTESIAKALHLLAENNYSQLPVTSGDRVVGSVTENKVYETILKNPDMKAQPVESIMESAFPFVDISTGIDVLSDMVSGGLEAVLVKDFKKDKLYIITRFDIADMLSR